MEVGRVREDVAGGDAAQGIVAAELPDAQLDTRSVVVEAPEVERTQREIRDEHLVPIATELEERQFRGRLVRVGSAVHHEAIRVRPSGRLIAELGHLDVATGGHVPQMGQLALDRPGQPPHDDEAGPPGFKPFDRGMVVEAFVGGENGRPNPRGDFVPAGADQGERPTRGVDIASPGRSSPCQKSLVWPSKHSSGW